MWVFSAHVDQSAEEPRWVPVPTRDQTLFQEQQAKCATDFGFQYCCFGQCRQLRHIHPQPKNLFRQWIEPPSTLADVLDFFDWPVCELLFAGDSLSYDHSMAVVCQLQQDHGYEVHGPCNVSGFAGALAARERNERRQERYAEGGARVSFTFWLGAFATWTSRKVSGCERAVPFRQKPCRWHAADGCQVLAPDWWPTGVELGGSTVTRKAACRTRMTKNFRPLIEDADGALQNWTVMWRETEPRHFLNPGGFYETGHNRSCGAVVVNNYRNEVAAAWFARPCTRGLQHPYLRRSGNRLADALWRAGLHALLLHPVALSSSVRWHAPGVAAELTVSAVLDEGMAVGSTAPDRAGATAHIIKIIQA